MDPFEEEHNLYFFLEERGFKFIGFGEIVKPSKDYVVSEEEFKVIYALFHHYNYIFDF